LNGSWIVTPAIDCPALWIWLFDTPEIGPGSIPIDERSLAKNGSRATFESVGARQVWIAVAYDEKGGFGGSAPPPSGAPIAIYSSEGGAPTAVVPGEKGAVTIVFDDSIRMP
jgi:hypothetical protein